MRLSKSHNVAIKIKHENICIPWEVTVKKKYCKK